VCCVGVGVGVGVGKFVHKAVYIAGTHAPWRPLHVKRHGTPWWQGDVPSAHRVVVAKSSRRMFARLRHVAPPLEILHARSRVCKLSHSKLSHIEANRSSGHGGGGACNGYGSVWFSKGFGC
jgi:hypothetical protein